MSMFLDGSVAGAIDGPGNANSSSVPCAKVAHDNTYD